jgi:hypothetical protein
MVEFNKDLLNDEETNLLACLLMDSIDRIVLRIMDEKYDDDMDIRIMIKQVSDIRSILRKIDHYDWFERKYGPHNDW